jgi:hypothetical protein
MSFFEHQLSLNSPLFYEEYNPEGYYLIEKLKFKNAQHATKSLSLWILFGHGFSRDKKIEWSHQLEFHIKHCWDVPMCTGFYIPFKVTNNHLLYSVFLKMGTCGSQTLPRSLLL